MHINYKRGETREFIFRKEYAEGRRRRVRGRKGLTDWKFHKHMIGIRNWCPCCLPAEVRRKHNGLQDPRMRREVHRWERRYGKQLCVDGLKYYEEEK